MNSLALALFLSLSLFPVFRVLYFSSDLHRFSILNLQPSRVIIEISAFES